MQRKIDRSDLYSIFLFSGYTVIQLPDLLTQSYNWIAKKTVKKKANGGKIQKDQSVTNAGTTCVPPNNLQLTLDYRKRIRISSSRSLKRRIAKVESNVYSVMVLKNKLLKRTDRAC